MSIFIMSGTGCTCVLGKLVGIVVDTLSSINFVMCFEQKLKKEVLLRS